MWGAVAGLSWRPTLLALSAAGRTRVLGSGAARRRGVSARSCHGLSDFHPGLDYEETPLWSFGYRFDPKRYVTDPKLVRTVAKILQKPQKTCQLFMECNPGPGILTKAFVESGHKVVALESDSTFIPHLETLQSNWGGKLQVVHCDFFKLDPRNGGIVKPPIMLSQMLFKNLGIEAVPWKAGIPFKVIASFPIKNERRILWKILHDLYSCTSIFRYGRIELNMFISESEYQKLVASPRTAPFYQPLSVLWQVACDIKLLHVAALSQMQQRICFVRMTPRKNLFTENLTPINYDTFFHMTKQCFVKRSARLLDHLPSLSPIDTRDLLKRVNHLAKLRITNMYPKDFKQLFETVECFDEYTYKWLYDDIMEEVSV
ncbi:PREDICTED: dimethyladenosine transferase 2, mitochondrial isoform X2 [Condylura cristata]|uniref:dimethyladenosine transferase 2, mitochondrial isoform X2 n=1 Tax=Condylura cristata TaxID=143302 RepID=UPI000643AAF2|nr:PREDICTED: dimethyladenosine transferase 2, mitochondrial isoform X2 [Condylura cristata]